MSMIYRYDQLHCEMKYEDMAKIEYYHTDKRIHLGQLKLLMLEIYFLTKYAKDGHKVLYVGSADGEHINLLVKFFPKLTFDLWDNRQFKIKESERVKIYNELFTTQDAKKYVKDGKNILLISDIRNVGIGDAYKNGGFEEAKIIKNKDNELQLEWVKKIKPYATSLKFSLNYVEGKTEYLDGNIYLQPFNSIGEETRIITRDYNKMTIYDDEQYDNKLSCFNAYRMLFDKNSETRWKNILDNNNIKNIWDTNMALWIFHRYLKKYNNKEPTDQECMDMFLECIKFLGRTNNKKYGYIFNDEKFPF